MEILKQDLKRGLITLKPINMDDLWHLQQILEIGDKVTSKTERRITIKRGSEIVKGEREIITLTISVGKINLDGQLRLTGKIVEGPENVTHEHHTLSIEPGTVLTIEKESGIESLGSVSPKQSGTRLTSKTESGDRTEYYKEVMETIENRSEYIVVAGPGFEKENL